MTYQERFWREIDQLKIHICYLEFYLEETIRIDRWINILLAIASNSSIAGWAIWREYSSIWAFIIALSQTINAVKVYLPYSRRLKALQGLANDLEVLFLSMEGDWFEVSKEHLTEESLHKLPMRYKEKRHQFIH